MNQRDIRINLPCYIYLNSWKGCSFCTDRPTVACKVRTSNTCTNIYYVHIVLLPQQSLCKHNLTVLVAFTTNPYILSFIILQLGGVMLYSYQGWNHYWLTQPFCVYMIIPFKVETIIFQCIAILKRKWRSVWAYHFAQRSAAEQIQPRFTGPIRNKSVFAT